MGLGIGTQKEEELCSRRYVWGGLGTVPRPSKIMGHVLNQDALQSEEKHEKKRKKKEKAPKKFNYFKSIN